MICDDREYHPTSWSRQIFKQYVRYPYLARKLDFKMYMRLLLSVPRKRCGRSSAKKTSRL